MSTRSKAGAAYAHVAALLQTGEPLPPDAAAWLAERLARVADVLLDSARPDTDVVKALGARNRQGRKPNAEKPARDAERVEAVAKVQREHCGKSVEDAARIVALERKELAARMRELFGTSPEVEAVARRTEVSEHTLRHAVENRRKR